MRIFKAHAAGEVGSEEHRAVFLPGKAAGPLVGAVTQFLSQSANFLLGRVRHGIAVVQRFGHGGDGAVRRLCQIVDRHRHGFSQPFNKVSVLS